MASADYYMYSSDSSSDSETASGPQCLEFSNLMLDDVNFEYKLQQIAFENSSHNPGEYYEALVATGNRLTTIPTHVTLFRNLHSINLSGNNLCAIPDCILGLENLTSLVIKQNAITNSGIPKDFGNMKALREINLSGNCLTLFPDQFLDLTSLKFLYIGSNRISELPRDIVKLQKLQVLYLGGNQLTEIPSEIGYLKSLQALVLCENQLESLPSSVAQLKKLRSLLLHKNHLTTLPPEIVTLKGLMELSLRDNPLVVRFVRDMTYSTPSLLELSARVVKLKSIPFKLGDIPRNLEQYLTSAHHCVNPKCRGVYFDSRVEHVRFVDFCGMYRLPLLQYLCSPSCTNQPVVCSETDSDSDSDYRLRKVLLG